MEKTPLHSCLNMVQKNEGYWTYEHLVIQLEDCMDILTVLYPTDKYEIQTLVDHSSGHDRQHEDGLNVNGMNKYYGGSQRVMHSSLMKDQGCLDKHLPKLAVGDTQEMMFLRDDSGPFYMPENERLKLKEDDLEKFKFATIQKNKLLK